MAASSPYERLEAALAEGEPAFTLVDLDLSASVRPTATCRRACGSPRWRTPARRRRRSPAVARALQPGDRVYLRHAEAHELCQRFDTLPLVAGERVVDEVPTYRGEGHSFP